MVADDTATLVARGRSQYLAGESAAAAETFRQAGAQDPGNTDAQYFLKRIADETAAGSARARTSRQMMSEVDQAWQRPGVIEPKPAYFAVQTVFAIFDRTIVRAPAAVSLAIPKSMILTTGTRSTHVTRTFDGLISRWMTA